MLILAVFVGALFGGYQYLPDLTDRMLPLAHLADEEGPSELSETRATQLVIENSPDLDTLVALSPPAKAAPLERWMAFLHELHTLPMPRYARHVASNPLLGWYAYVAKYRPEAIYASYDLYGRGAVNGRIFEHLVKTGFLKDWFHHLSDPQAVLLYKSYATYSYALEHEPEQARRQLADYWLAELAKPDTAVPTFDLDQLSYAMYAMTDAEIRTLVPLMLENNADVDPRDISQLVHEGYFEREDLLMLIRKNAYPDKSMSAFVTTAVQLGADEYVEPLLQDLLTNDRQPLHFYCAPCALALTSDGLIAEALLEAYAKHQLTITSPAIGEYVFSRGSEQKSKGSVKEVRESGEQ
jgi:hypothetical protein